MLQTAEEFMSKELYEELNKKVQAVYAALKVATDYADEHKLSFEFGAAYGMGGSYVGDPRDRDYPDTCWYPSSSSC